MNVFEINISVQSRASEEAVLRHLFTGCGASDILSGAHETRMSRRLQKSWDLSLFSLVAFKMQTNAHPQQPWYPLQL